MNIDIVKYPLTTFYAKIAVHEHSAMREELLSLISKVTSDPHQYIDKLDWASGKDLNNRDWILKAEPVIRKYISAMAIASKYKGPIFEAMWFQQYVKEGDIIHRSPQVTEELRKTIISWNLLFEDTEFKSI
jgi:hypothetical protein